MGYDGRFISKLLMGCIKCLAQRCKSAQTRIPLDFAPSRFQTKPIGIYFSMIKNEWEEKRETCYRQTAVLKFKKRHHIEETCILKICIGGIYLPAKESRFAFFFFKRKSLNNLYSCPTTHFTMQ